MKIKHHPFVRKGLAQCNRLRRLVRRMGSCSEDYRRNPPVLCNSFPKSGTHLLLQVLEALPGKHHFGSFIATVPSISFRQRSRATISRKIRAMAPSEIVPAHLYCSDWAADVLAAKHCVHYFIYRDPRDVVLSEAYYLTNMAWWHALHRPFKNAGSDAERLKLSIRGMGDRYPEYPDIGKRFERYEGWIHRADTFGVRFEDLVGPHREQVIRDIVDFYATRADAAIDVEETTQRALANIQPSKSHTFHRGESGRGSSAFSAELREEFLSVAGDVLTRLSYAVN